MDWGMTWALGALITLSDEKGSGKGWVRFAILGLYVAVMGAIAVAWIQWARRQREGAFQWGSYDYRRRVPHVWSLLRGANQRVPSSRDDHREPEPEPAPTREPARQPDPAPAREPERV
jgi:hypothetical protein